MFSTLPPFSSLSTPITIGTRRVRRPAMGDTLSNASFISRNRWSRHTSSSRRTNPTVARDTPKSKQNELGLTFGIIMSEKPLPAVIPQDASCNCQDCAVQGGRRSSVGQISSGYGHGHEFH